MKRQLASKNHIGRCKQSPKRRTHSSLMESVEPLIYGAEGRVRKITASFDFIEAESENVVEAHMQQPLRLRAGKDEMSKSKARCIMGGHCWQAGRTTAGYQPLSFGLLKVEG